MTMKKYLYNEEQTMIENDNLKKVRIEKAEKEVAKMIKGNENNFDFILKLYNENENNLKYDILADILMELDEERCENID